MATAAQQLKAWLDQGAVIAAQLELQTTAAPVGAAGSSGTTAPDWTEPPSPWPISLLHLSEEQVARLSPDGRKRANDFSQALQSSAMAGNGQNPVPAALWIYRAGFMDNDSIYKPLDATWAAIFAAYGVKP